MSNKAADLGVVPWAWVRTRFDRITGAYGHFEVAGLGGKPSVCSASGFKTAGTIIF